MTRWIVILCGLLVAAGLGLLVGYGRWGGRAAQVERAEQRLQSVSAETTTLRAENRDLEQRLEQVSKEQERLAHENEILREQQNTAPALTGHGGELPALPPK